MASYGGSYGAGPLGERGASDVCKEIGNLRVRRVDIRSEQGADPARNHGPVKCEHL